MKQNVLRKNLLLNENNIDYGNVDPIFEARNKEGFVDENHPYVEVLEGSDEYISYMETQVKKMETAEFKAKKQELINTSKSYLSQTDYHFTKSSEAFIIKIIEFILNEKQKEPTQSEDLLGNLQNILNDFSNSIGTEKLLLINQKRQQARDEIGEIEKSESLDELNAFVNDDE